MLQRRIVADRVEERVEVRQQLGLGHAGAAEAAREQDRTLTAADVRSALLELDPLWDELFLAEQLVPPTRLARMIQAKVDILSCRGAIGPAAAGFLQWAAGNGRKPLEILEHLARVSLPHFSRLQHDEREVESTLSRYVTLFVLASGLWLSVLAVGIGVIAYIKKFFPDEVSVQQRHDARDVAEGLRP